MTARDCLARALRGGIREVGENPGTSLNTRGDNW